MLGKWVTTQQAFKCKPAAAGRAVLGYSMLRIMRATRFKAAMGAQHRRDTPLVQAYYRKGHLGGNATDQ